jgi:glycosyltransferase involved in cell wall biosynthesis
MEPLVSILIPAFNAEAWIAETLESALAQTWPRKEIIVIDDGSSDGTLGVLRTFECRGITVFTQPNCGAAATRNRAFSMSKGDYIQWLDADDLLAPDKISKQLESLGAHPSKGVLLSCSWGRFIYRYKRARFRPTRLWCDLSPAEWMFRYMEENIYMQTSTWLVSRQLTEAAGPWNTNLLGDDDGEYFSRVLFASKGSRFVPAAKVYYRMAGSNSLSYVGRSERKREAQWLSMRLRVSYLLNVDNSPRARAACVRYLQNWMIFFYPDRPDIFAQAKSLAQELGGDLQTPTLPWKYLYISKVLGWPVAARAQVLLPMLRFSLRSFWDRTLLRMENRSTFKSHADQH